MFVFVWSEKKKKNKEKIQRVFFCVTLFLPIVTKEKKNERTKKMQLLVVRTGTPTAVIRRRRRRRRRRKQNHGIGAGNGGGGGDSCRSKTSLRNHSSHNSLLRIHKRMRTKEQDEKGTYLWLLDRDGVINEDVGSPGVVDVDRFKVLPRVKDSLWTIRRSQRHAKIVVVTNQTCVGKGLITEAYLTDIIHKKMNDELLLSERNGTEEDTFFDAILYETTKASIPNRRRKPEPGMIEEAADMFPPPDKHKVIFVGDSMTDMMAAGRAEIQSGRSITRVLVGTGYGSRVWNALVENEEDCDADDDFYYYAEKIIKRRGSCDNSIDVVDSSESILQSFPAECFPLYITKDLADAVDIFI